MSSKKPVGNRWAAAVEGAADTLLDAGKASVEETPVTPSQDTQESSPRSTKAVGEIPKKKDVTPKTQVAPVKKAPAASSTSSERMPSGQKAVTQVARDASTEDHDDEHSTRPTVAAAPSMDKPAQVEVAVKPATEQDPLELALSMKGRKGRTAGPRTFYLENDLSEKLSSLARELDKTESQLLRDILRAVFKMNN